MGMPFREILFGKWRSAVTGLFELVTVSVGGRCLGELCKSRGDEGWQSARGLRPAITLG